jgi:creatinine amidohydrolase/Fe(II)-dependent formamide hydrolase-like protein
MSFLRRLAASLALAAFVLTTPAAHAADTVEMADMTWPEVRAAIERGVTTAIVPSGGIEQNGPHMVLGKHDYIVRSAANRIAVALGNALVAPVNSYVPEGDYMPPTGNLLYPGTLGVPEPVFAGVLEGIARSLKNTGFKTIALIGDHGGNQAAQALVAAKLNREWAREGTGQVKVLNVTDYYIDEAQMKFLRGKGETDATIGSHAGLIDTAELMSVRPAGVDLSKLKSYSRKEAPGHSGEPARATPDLGKALLDIRVNAAIKQIKAAQ